MDSLADDPPETDTFSAWLGDQDLERLAAVARAARSAGDSFGRCLRVDGRRQDLLDD
ncbi:hypothetical protein PHK61_06810 [Actinomycetospora lutea]|uniref:hypothetical protein n=1 Tax=Actinomycetospora lutea TaxID=663604 RepID=UPI0023668ECD|nr:hypothetical protein [Actinomycetospora lutea]MDD7938126.1 hypothetical protein [Actinomycetospora lutea]